MGRGPGGGGEEGGWENLESTVITVRQVQPAVMKQRQLLCPSLRAREVPRLQQTGEEVSTLGTRERKEGFG